MRYSSDSVTIVRKSCDNDQDDISKMTGVDGLKKRLIFLTDLQTKESGEDLQPLKGMQSRLCTEVLSDHNERHWEQHLSTVCT